jgi:hypothetical protein
MAGWYDDPSSEAFADHYGLEDEPDADDYLDRFFRSLQRPAAFIYAVRVAAGIKVGMAGSGTDSDPVDQLCARITNYRSTSPVQVLGLMAVKQGRAKREEAKLHQKLTDYRVPRAGRELFRDCPEVTEQLQELMQGHWIDDTFNVAAGSDLFHALETDPLYRTGVSDFDAEWNPSKGWSSPFFGWRDWARLRSELALVRFVGEDDADIEEVTRYAAEMNWLPEEDGGTEDNLAATLLEELLPANETARPRLRKRFDLWVRNDPAHGFQPWWDSALERNNLMVVAKS